MSACIHVPNVQYLSYISLTAFSIYSTDDGCFCVCSRILSANDPILGCFWFHCYSVFVFVIRWAMCLYLAGDGVRVVSKLNQIIFGHVFYELSGKYSIIWPDTRFCTQKKLYRKYVRSSFTRLQIWLGKFSIVFVYLILDRQVLTGTEHRENGVICHFAKVFFSLSFFSYYYSMVYILFWNCFLEQLR